MDTIIYLFLCIAYFILLVVGVRSAIRTEWLTLGNVLLLVTVALLYDNGILTIGKYLGKGELLQQLNAGRYWLHALITPLLVPFAWHTLIRAKVSWAKKRSSQWLIRGLTLFLIIYELVTVTTGLTLEPSWKYGVLSYRDLGDSGAPPIMIMGVSLMLLFTSIIIWWKQKWPWYFLGIIAMGIPALGHFFLKSGALHNISELLLMIGLFATKFHQDKM